MHEEPRTRLATIPHLGRTLILFWLLYSVFHASFDVACLRAAGEPVDFARLALSTLVQSMLWAAVSWLLFTACAFAFSRPRPLTRRLAFVGGMFGAWVLRVIVFGISQPLLGSPPRLDGASFVRAVQTGAVGIALFTGTLTATITGLYWWQRQLQAARLRAESEGTLVRTELGVVAEQLEPHFLMNTLTAISALAARDPIAAREMLTGLQDLLTYSVRHGAAGTVSLEDEVHFVRQYLRLQSLRFGSRLRSRVDIPDELLPCRVPRLILQPLVENAVKHGVASCEEGGEITVEAARGPGTLIIYVRNSSGGTPAAPGIGIGMAAVRARLALLFGSRQQVTLAEEGSGVTVVTVTMPMVRNSPAGRRGVAA